MRKLSLVLRIVSGALVALVAFVFAVLEVTLLVTLDFALYENQFIAFIQLALRIALALAALALGVLSLVKPGRSFLREGICLTASTAVMIPFVSNNVGLYFTAVAAFFLIAHLLFHKFGREEA
jgi:hypothetical protein